MDAARFLDPDQTRLALSEVLHQRGVECTERDLFVCTTTTRLGYPVHVVIALNGADAGLKNLVARMADRRNSVVSTGVFVLRPDDIARLVRRTMA